MPTVTLLHHPFLHVPLMIEGIETYAALNFEHKPSGKGLVLSNRIYVYLLDSLMGSVTFYLKYDRMDDYYYIETTELDIDSLVIYFLNEAIKDHLMSIKLLSR